MSKTTIIVNNINTKNDEDTLLADLMLEMGIALGLDIDKPITAFVSVVSHKDDTKDIDNGLFSRKYKS